MMVATALEYLDNLSRTAKSDSGLQWELAKAYEKVGDVQGSPIEPSLGHTAAALNSYKKALALQEDLAGRGLLDSAQRESLAHAYAQTAAAYRAIGPPADAVKAAERGLYYASGVSEAAQAHALSHLALAQTFAGEPALALKSEQAAESFLSRGVLKEAGWGRMHQELAAVLLTAARAEARMALFGEAADDLHQAIALREAHLAETAPDTVSARELVLAYQTLGDVLGASDRFSLGQSAQAAVWYRKALALAEKLSESDPKNVTAKIEIARSSGKLGAVLEKANPREALRLYARALDVSETLVPDALDREALRGSAYASMAAPLAQLGNVREALKKLDIAITISETQRERTPKSRALLGDLADEWLERGNIVAGEEDFRKSLAFADSAAAVAPNDFSVAFRQVQALEALIGRQPADGEELRRRLVELWKKWQRIQPQSPFISKMRAQAEQATLR